MHKTSCDKDVNMYTCCCSATVALLASAPSPAGAALVGQAFSPHLDLHQRLFVLESLSAGARALARAPAEPTNPGASWALERPSGAAPALGGSGRAAGEAGGGVRGGAGGGRQVGVSRRWGVRALAKLQAPPARTRRNRSASELGFCARQALQESCCLQRVRVLSLDAAQIDSIAIQAITDECVRP